MKFLTSSTLKFLTVTCLVINFVAVVAKEKTKIQYKNDELAIDFGGKLHNEIFFSQNLTFLNANSTIDSIYFNRTTFDFFSTFAQGDYKDPRISFYDTLRFRFVWGNTSNVKVDDGTFKIANSDLTVKGTNANKHLLWMRESWLKIRLGSLGDYKNYFQIGLIPYQVGRGISLGAAYDASGFLGFVPGSSIDQYAPGMVFSFNPVPNRCIVDFYVALLENKQTSLSETSAPVRKKQLGGACEKRGIGHQSYIIALRSMLDVINDGNQKTTFEPYIVHQHAPDQDLEFTVDVDTFLSTAGFAIENSADRFSCGMETAVNFGEMEIKAWDRNANKLTVDDNGNIIEQYTKVFTQDPSTIVAPATPAAATHTKDIENLLKGSAQDRSMNGKLVGTVDATPIYNAFDRFRPKQTRLLGGYFFVADAAYDCIPKVLNCAVGFGYASGYNDPQRDVNIACSTDLLNEKFTGFLPLQSVYSGKRLRHLVIFNQGIPRFNVRYPNADLSQKNVTTVLTTDTINEMTNIAFIGTRLDWKVERFSDNKVNISQNIIAYWAPETAYIANTNTRSDNYLGTEFATEASAFFYDNLKLSGYFGFLVPGQHYKDMAGTVIKAYKQTTGSDIGYVGNVGLSYIF